MSPPRETGSERAVRIVRTFNASAAQLFDCFTDPAKVAAWWGPEGIECPSAENNLRIGGKFRFAMRSTDGSTDMAACGEYLVIERPARLAFTWYWEGSPELVTRVSLTFTALATDRAELELIHDRFDTDERAALHDTGWSSSLACLDVALQSDRRPQA